MKSLYAEIGGRAVVDFAVDLFYRKVLADPLLGRYFDDTDIALQMRAQCLFLAYALGRLPHYAGQPIRDAHRHMELRDVHFDTVAGHLAATLQELAIPPHLCERVMEIVATTRDDVLNRDLPAPADGQA